MKTKIIILIVSLMFAYSCKKTETTDVKKEEVKAEEKVKITEEDLKKVEVKDEKKEEVKAEVKVTVEDYTKFLATLDISDGNSISKAAAFYKEKLKGADTKLTDECYAKFAEFYEKVMFKLDETFSAKEEKDQIKIYEFFAPSDQKSEGEMTQAQKDYAQFLKTNGLRIETTEGTFFVYKDGKYLNDTFKDFVSSSMKEYLAQKEKENKEGYASDAGLTILPKDITERIIFWENFVKKNPDFIYTKEQKDSITFMTLDLLIGMDNTPVFDYETNKLSETFKEGYKFVIEKHPDSEIGKIIKEYYAILEKNGFKDSKDRLAFISKHTPKTE